MLTWLSRLDRTKAFLGSLVLALLALFLPGAAGALVLLLLVAVLGLLARLTWSVTPVGMRAVRLVVLASLTLIALSRLL